MSLLSRLSLRRACALALAVTVTSSVAALVPVTEASAAASAYLSGPDVSHYQHAAGPVNWSSISGPGQQAFAISKATENTNFTDPFFAADRAAERANGLIRGAYHYARPQLPISTAITQADFYAATLGNDQEVGDLPPIMDFEESGGLAPRDLITWGQTFLGELMAKTGRVPMIYTYRNFWRTAMLNSSAFTRYPLWIADYTDGAAAPTPPLVGDWPTWTMWQWTSTDKLPGVTGAVDDSHFNGSSAALAAFADGTHPSVLTPAAPTAPVSVQAGPAGDALTVSWIPGDNGGEPLTSYRVTVSPGGVSITVPGTQTSVVVPGLGARGLYTASVVAFSPAGASDGSVSSSPIGASQGVVPVTLLTSKTHATLLSGHNAQLTGTLVRADGQGGVGSVPLVVFAKLTGGSGYTAVTSAITYPDGHWAVQVSSGVTTRYEIRYAGGAGWSPAKNNILIYAQVSLSVALSRTTVPRNAKVALRGQASPAAVGRIVYRQRWYDNAWHTGPATRVSKDGFYSFTVRPTVTGKTKLRVIMGSHDGLVGAYTKTAVLNVR